MGERVVVAMSGGVDSSVAAALLVDRGHDVVGVSMRLWEAPDGAERSGCCSLDDYLDARRVAERLGIPFYVIDFSREFRERVVADFVAEYRRGRTPNPCARCNQFVKFTTFWDRARDLGATKIATGHYARTRRGERGAELLRGVDVGKDQSYYLFGIETGMLERVLFPVGEWDKPRVREEAARRDLAVAAKPDSQEICFAPRQGYADFVARYGGEPAPPGRLIDETGRVVGGHDGVHRFTIGQRRGLGVSAGEARYVTAIEPETGVVRIGPRAALTTDGLRASEPNWLGPTPCPGDRLQVKIRSRFEAVPAEITAIDAAGFALRAPGGLTAVSPGQAAVLYDGDRVVGGGWIESACCAG